MYGDRKCFGYSPIVLWSGPIQIRRVFKKPFKCSRLAPNSRHTLVSRFWSSIGKVHWQSVDAYRCVGRLKSLEDSRHSGHLWRWCHINSQLAGAGPHAYLGCHQASQCQPLTTHAFCRYKTLVTRGGIVIKMKRWKWWSGHSWISWRSSLTCISPRWLRQDSMLPTVDHHHQHWVCYWTSSPSPPPSSCLSCWW